jgi:hypothetical protein
MKNIYHVPRIADIIVTTRQRTRHCRRLPILVSRRAGPVGAGRENALEQAKRGVRRAGRSASSTFSSSLVRHAREHSRITCSTNDGQLLWFKIDMAKERTTVIPSCRSRLGDHRPCAFRMRQSGICFVPSSHVSPLAPRGLRVVGTG